MKDRCRKCKGDEIMHSVTYGICPEHGVWIVAEYWWCADCGALIPHSPTSRNKRKKKRALGRTN